MTQLKKHDGEIVAIKFNRWVNDSANRNQSVSGEAKPTFDTADLEMKFQGQ